jgi:hypothetical protein
VEGRVTIGLKLVAAAWFVLWLVPAASAQDCNRNGVPDSQDIAVGTSQDCNGNGIPDECEVYGLRRLPISGLAAEDEAGRAAAIRGDLALVGAPNDGTYGTWTGAVYALRFVGGNWVQEQKLMASDAAEYGSFGSSIAMNGDVAVIGASGRDISRGAAYVFRRIGSAWVEEQILTASDAAEYDFFGAAVATDGAVIWVGASHMFSGGGAAYVFRWDGSSWTGEVKVSVPDEMGVFGSAVALDGDVVVVGDGFVAEGCVGAGAYVFRWNGSQWEQEAKLEPPPGDDASCFSSTVAVSGDVIWIGAPGAEGYKGAAYVYRRDGASWGQPTRLTSADGEQRPEYGASVAVDGDLAVVGAPQADEGGASAGAAYFYRWNGAAWIKEAKPMPSDVVSGDHFGQAVAINDGRALIGAPYRDEPADYAGAAYVVTIPEPTALPDCNRNGIPDECDIAEGTSTDCNVNGVPDECELRDGTSADCNANGKPDECDIAGGASRDCDVNAVPDECEMREVTRLNPSSNYYGYLFGSSVAAEEDLLVVGAPGTRYTNDEAGSVRVFRWSGTAWAQEATLYARSRYRDHFGACVATDGGRIAAGSPDHDSKAADCGSAQVYTWNGTGWGSGTMLTPSDGLAYDHFGTSVAVSGDLVVVGAPGRDDHGTNSGAVYVYRWNGASWTQTKLLASGPASQLQLGYSVATDGNVIVATGTGSWPSGAVYVFRWSGSQWGQEAVLKPLDLTSDSHFGESLSISGDAIVAGALGDDDRGYLAGAAYVFRHSGAAWIQEAKLVASDAAPYDTFGHSLALDGHLLVVSATGDDDHGEYSGSTYLFQYTGTRWIERAKLTAPDGMADDFFGEGVGVRGQTIVVGLPGRTQSAGSAYAYRLHNLDWDATPDLCDLCPATIDGVLVDINGCPPFVPGDFDRDGDVDRADLAAFESCASCPGASYPAGCEAPDLDDDSDIDQSDFALFQRCVSGQNLPADPDCAS